MSWNLCNSNLVKRYPLLLPFHLPHSVASSLDLRLLVPLAENHHPGGIRAPESRESRLVQAALSSLNLLTTDQLKGIAAGRSTLARGVPSFNSSVLILTVN